MIPIHELLNRIRHDPQFARAEYMIGYYDRVEARVIVVPLRELHFEPQDRFGVEIVDANGDTRTIPYHRVRQVFQNGAVIWQRPD